MRDWAIYCILHLAQRCDHNPLLPTMSMTDTRDILFIVMSLAIAWFTVFLCWLLYQAGRVLRNANRVMEHGITQLELMRHALDFIRDKVDRISGAAGAVSRSVAGVLEKVIASSFSASLEGRAARRSDVRTERSKMPPKNSSDS